MPWTARSLADAAALPPARAIAAGALDVGLGAVRDRRDGPIVLGDAEIDRLGKHAVDVLVTLGHEAPQLLAPGAFQEPCSDCRTIVQCTAGRFGELFRRAQSSNESAGGHHMRAEDLILVSVDDHLVEPPHMFDAHIPEKYRDRAPKIVHSDDGSDVWVFNDAVIPNIGLNAVAGRPKEEYGIEPTAFDEIRQGCWNIDERIKDMNAGGVLGSMCFPSFPAFSGRLFAAADDKDLALAVVRAYNDWHVDEWCGAYPGRFIPMGLPVLVGSPACGRRGTPAGEEGRALAHVHREPLDAGLSELPRRPLGSVVEGGVRRGRRAVDPPRFVGQVGRDRPRCTGRRDDHVAAHEHLRGRGRSVVVPGAQGVPGDSDRVVRRWHGLDPVLPRSAWTARTRCITCGPARTSATRLPSDVFREHFLTCFISDPIGIKLRHDIGIDNIAWECDYPHSDSSWPEAPEELAAVAAGVSGRRPDKIGHENAMRWFSFDPFAHRDKKDCTVGALRAEAAGHDVAIRAVRQGSLREAGRYRSRTVGAPRDGVNGLGE